MNHHLSGAAGAAWIEQISLPLFVIDANQRVIVWNAACARLTGVPHNRMLGTSDYWTAFYDKPRHCLIDLFFVELSQPLQDYCVRRHIKIEQDGRYIKKLVMEEWREMPHTKESLFLVTEVIPVYNASGQIQMVCQTFQDLTDFKRAQALLQQRSTTDPLTGLATRRTFEEQLIVEWQRAQRQKTAISIVLLDIDQFRRYNEAHGHKKGDECLKELAALFQRGLGRATDLVARYGGDEFILLLPATNEDGAQTVAHRIVDAMTRLASYEYQYDGQFYRLTLTVAVSSFFPEEAHSYEYLIQQAEEKIKKKKVQFSPSLLSEYAVKAESA